MAVDRSSVREMAMNRAAGTPFPDTSATTKPSVLSSMRK